MSTNQKSVEELQLIWNTRVLPQLGGLISEFLEDAQKLFIAAQQDPKNVVVGESPVFMPEDVNRAYFRCEAGIQILARQLDRLCLKVE